MKNSNIKLIVGLGNPGEKYKKNRHNTGFRAVDKIADKLNFSPPTGGFNFQSKFNADVLEGMIDNEKIILAKPQTFMNESGIAVKAISDYYKIPIENITVIHDDLDIPLGEYKIAKNRSSAGHKGVQSVIDHLETKDFTRIRIGIGTAENKIFMEKFVLENFTEKEQEIVDEIIEKVCEEVEIWIKK